MSELPNRLRNCCGEIGEEAAAYIEKLEEQWFDAIRANAELAEPATSFFCLRGLLDPNDIDRISIPNEVRDDIKYLLWPDKFKKEKT